MSNWLKNNLLWTSEHQSLWELLQIKFVTNISRDLKRFVLPWASTFIGYFHFLRRAMRNLWLAHISWWGACCITKMSEICSELTLKKLERRHSSGITIDYGAVVSGSQCPPLLNSCSSDLMVNFLLRKIFRENLNEQFQPMKLLHLDFHRKFSLGQKEITS